MRYQVIGSRVRATVGATVLSPEVPAHADAIMIQNLDATDDLAYTLDGSTPSASVGFTLFHSAAATPNAAPVTIPLPYNGSIKLIRAAAADVTVEYQFIRQGNGGI